MFRSIFAILFRFVLILSLFLSRFFLFSGSCSNWCHAMQGLQGYAEICRDMQGYSCTRLHNLNRPSERDKEGRERELCGTATCSCYVSKLQLPRDGSEMAQLLLEQDRLDVTAADSSHFAQCPLVVVRLRPTAYCLLALATCHMPHAACRTASASATVH